MAIEQLNVKKRDFTGKKNQAIRLAGYIPAVVYGPDMEAMNLMLSVKDFEGVLAKAGTSSIIVLNVEGGDKLEVLIHDVQYHPVSDHIIHVDFYKPQAGHKLTVEVPLEFINEVSAKTGTLYIEKESVEVECLPKDLIEKIEVDLSQITDDNDIITVADLNVPEGIDILDEDNVTVAHIVQDKTEAEVAEDLGENTEAETDNTLTGDSQAE